MRDLFVSQKQAIDHFFEHVDLAQMEKVVGILSECQGTVVFSGVGKSGLIAQKMAATFVSTGTRAIFLCPTNALHGDIGILGKDDIFVALSKSGASEELLDVLPYVQKKGARTIAVVSFAGSKLEKACTETVHLPLLRELCPHDLAPTTSTAIQLIFGDILAVALMRKKNFSVADFAGNHPGGLLGRKITLKVSDLMFKGEWVPFCRQQDRLIDRLPELSEKKCGCLIVVEEGRLQGIFTDGDLRRAIQAKGANVLECKMGELMTSAPRTVALDRMAIEAIRIMEEKLITVLPVLDGENVVGLIRLHDIVQAGLQ